MTNFIDLHCHSTFSSAMTAGELRAPSLSKTEAAWLAGILEGEGWFGDVRSRAGGRRYPIIAVKMKDLDVIQKVADLFGGMAITNPKTDKGDDIWVVRARGKRAISIMQQVYPFMGNRRRETIDGLFWVHND